MELACGAESGVGDSTQNTQYDQIGGNYMAIKQLAGVEAELPSVTAALGSVQNKRCLGMLSIILLHIQFLSFMKTFEGCKFECVSFPVV
jgi:hypothetical protein